MGALLSGAYNVNTFNTTLVNIDEATRISYGQNDKFVRFDMEGEMFQKVIIGNTLTNPFGNQVVASMDEKSGYDMTFTLTNSAVKDLHTTPFDLVKLFNWESGSGRPCIIDAVSFYSANNTELTPSSSLLRLMNYAPGQTVRVFSQVAASSVFTATPQPVQAPVTTYLKRAANSTIALDASAAITGFDGDLKVYFSFKILPL